MKPAPSETGEGSVTESVARTSPLASREKTLIESVTPPPPTDCASDACTDSPGNVGTVAVEGVPRCESIPPERCAVVEFMEETPASTRRPEKSSATPSPAPGRSAGVLSVTEEFSIR